MRDDDAPRGSGGLRPPPSALVVPLSHLTPRQRQIAHLLAHSGLAYKEVADRVGIRGGTMRKHAENVYRRLGVHSRAELTVLLQHSDAGTLQCEFCQPS